MSYYKIWRTIAQHDVAGLKVAIQKVMIILLITGQVLCELLHVAFQLYFVERQVRCLQKTVFEVI